MCINNFKTGLCSISFRNLSAPEIIALVKNAGLVCIEWGSDVHAKPDDTESILEIVRLQKENGLFCSSYGTYFRIATDPVSDIYKYIKAAKLLGTDTLRLWCGNKASAEYSANERAAVIEECKKLADIAKAENVILCLECHIKTLTDDTDSTLDIMQKVDSENFRMYWQPNQFKTFEQNIDSCERISPFAKTVHVFNWREKEKYPLLLAKKQWQTYLEKFKDTTLLLEFMPDNNPESLKTEANSLFEIIGK